MTPEELIAEFRNQFERFSNGYACHFRASDVDELCDAYEALKAECEAHSQTIRILERERDKLIAEAEKAEAERDELRKRIAELSKATRVYFNGYMQDEADDVDNCVCGREQHEAAIAVRVALVNLEDGE